MEEVVIVFKYSRIISCKNKSPKGGMRKRTVKSRQVLYALKCYEREKCEYGSKEGYRIYYYPANSVMGIRDVE